jgi:hypothetical protein
MKISLFGVTAGTTSLAACGRVRCRFGATEGQGPTHPDAWKPCGPVDHPSPALKATLSPSDRERDGVRGSKSIPWSLQIHACGSGVLRLHSLGCQIRFGWGPVQVWSNRGAGLTHPDAWKPSGPVNHPSPALKGTLSPSDGERDGVRGRTSIPRSLQIQACSSGVLKLHSLGCQIRFGWVVQTWHLSGTRRAMVTPDRAECAQFAQHAHPNRLRSK